MDSRFGWMTFFALAWLFAIAALPTAASPLTIGAEEEEEQEPIEPWNEATVQLYDAIIAGDKDAVIAAIAAGADLQVTGEDPWDIHPNTNSLVSLAIAAEQPNIALLLIESGAGVNLPEDTRPLWWAARAGNLELIDACLEHGSDINHQPPGNGITALQTAIYFNHPQAVERLIDAGADLQIRTRNLNPWGIRNATPLEVAIRLDHTECVQLLEEAEAQESP